MFKDRISQESVRLDQSMARLQIPYVHTIWPISYILEEGIKGTLTPTKARMALQLI